MKLFHLTLLVTVCALLIFAAEIRAAEPVGNAANGADANAPKAKITISKETTYITEPLRADGYPDYVAALNQRMSEGVTPENNAAVLLQQAFGPNEIPKKLRVNYFQQLGVAPLPEKGDYLISRSEMVKLWHELHPLPADQVDDTEELDAQFDRGMQRPWSDGDFPIVAEWLNRNEKPLQLVIAASRRDDRFFPVLIEPDNCLISALIPQDQQIREAAFALAARSMYLAKQGSTAQAWQQVLACHRLARQMSKRCVFLVDSLVAFALESVAISATASLVHSVPYSEDDLRKMRSDLESLPPLHGVADSFDTGERFFFLDAVSWVAKRGIYAIRALSGDTKAQITSKGAVDASDALIDWDVPLQVGNEWFDRFVSISRVKDLDKRKGLLQRYEKDLKEVWPRAKEPHRLVRDFFTKTPKQFFSWRVTSMFIALLIPALQAVNVAQQRAELMEQMELTAMSLAAYRSHHTTYPNKLDELVPQFIAVVPIDTFSAEAAPIRYRREGDAYALWTVFLNGIDDDGRTAEDDPPGDDWVLRPVPKEKPTK
jgi:hypothetical protein